MNAEKPHTLSAAEQPSMGSGIDTDAYPPPFPDATIPGYDHGDCPQPTDEFLFFLKQSGLDQCESTIRLKVLHDIYSTQTDCIIKANEAITSKFPGLSVDLRLCLIILSCALSLESVINTGVQLAEHGIDISKLGYGGFMEATDKYEANDGVLPEAYCSQLKLGSEYLSVYQGSLVLTRVDDRIINAVLSRKPKLSDIPVMSRQFETLGIKPDLAQSMLNSWSTYFALGSVLGGSTGITNVALEERLVRQGKAIADQFYALAAFVEEYGISDTLEIIDTFGIYNFINYRPKQLHDQLAMWKSGEIPINNILVSSHADINGSLMTTPISVFNDIGDGLICFEIGSKRALAEVAVNAGKRERDNGRNPDIDRFIINTHGRQSGIPLGTSGERLEVGDYHRQPMGRNLSPNTYVRHLGHKCTVVFLSCHAADTSGAGRNIAETVCDHHRITTSGSPDRVYGVGAIVDDLVFNSGSRFVPAIKYVPGERPTSDAA